MPPPAPVTAAESTDNDSEEIERPFELAYNPYVRGESMLSLYYDSKYSRKERQTVMTGLKKILPDYRELELRQAADELLAFQYVVYHTTARHSISDNHKVADISADLVRKYAKLFDVPAEPVVAIVSWENSGSVSEKSWANAVGVGQMTPGAVETAHEYAQELSNAMKKEAANLVATGSSDDAHEAKILEEKAEQMNCAARHKELAAQRGVKDERQVKENNLEDAVVFFKYLYEKYDKRVDLAISAYHNGIVNNDDIIYDYLRTVKNETISAEKDKNREALLRAIARYDLKFIDLWNCRKSREMLCGARTVYGNNVTEANKHLALGDESDIYPWKVMGSYAGFNAGTAFVKNQEKKYADRWDLSEVHGLPQYDTIEKLNKAKEEQLLVKLKLKVTDCGITGVPPTEAEKKAAAKSGKKAPELTKELKEACYFVTPELSGYLAHLQKRFNQALGKKPVALPVRTLSGAWCLGSARQACVDKCTATHLRGVAVDLSLEKLSKVQRAKLTELLRSDFLMDKIYLSRQGDNLLHIVLNPRRGGEFLDSFVQYVSPKGKLAKALKKAKQKQAREEEKRLQQEEAERLQAEADQSAASSRAANAKIKASGHKKKRPDAASSSTSSKEEFSDDSLEGMPEEPSGDVSDGDFDLPAETDMNIDEGGTVNF